MRPTRGGHARHEHRRWAGWPIEERRGGNLFGALGARLALALLLLAAPALAARPARWAAQGGLEDRLVHEDAAGVLVRFLGISKGAAQAGLDAVVKQEQLSGGLLRVGFLKTQASTLAAIYPVAPVSMKRLKGLAAGCSKLEGVMAAYAFLHPGPRNQQLALEVYWSFEGGAPAGEKRLVFRDDPHFADWKMKRITGGQLEAKKWPGWPLSELAKLLGVPGREFLARPLGALGLAANGYPRDVGENLVLTVVYLPDATLLEIRQQAEKQGDSLSKVVQQTLIAAAGEEKLGVQLPASGRAPWDDEMPQADKSASRPLELFLTREIFNQLDERADEETESISKLVEYAWRQAHPYVVPRSP